MNPELELVGLKLHKPIIYELHVDLLPNGTQSLKIFSALLKTEFKLRTSDDFFVSTGQLSLVPTRYYSKETFEAQISRIIGWFLWRNRSGGSPCFKNKF